jgi:hypothetical protein
MSSRLVVARLLRIDASSRWVFSTAFCINCFAFFGISASVVIAR